DSDCFVIESVYENQDTKDDDSDSEVEECNEDEQTSDLIIKTKWRHVYRIITEFNDEEIKNNYRFIFIHTLTTDNNTI
ncbi:22067_t:CDS:1, partial [Gigaspora rosea]